MSYYLEPLGVQVASLSGWSAVKAWAETQQDLAALTAFVDDAGTDDVPALVADLEECSQRELEMPEGVPETLGNLLVELRGSEVDAVFLSDGMTDEDVEDDWVTPDADI